MNIEYLVKAFDGRILSLPSDYSHYAKKDIEKMFFKKISDNRCKIVAYIGEYEFRMIVKRKGEL